MKIFCNGKSYCSQIILFFIIPYFLVYVQSTCIPFITRNALKFQCDQCSSWCARLLRAQYPHTHPAWFLIFRAHQEQCRRFQKPWVFNIRSSLWLHATPKECQAAQDEQPGTVPFKRYQKVITSYA